MNLEEKIQALKAQDRLFKRVVTEAKEVEKLKIQLSKREKNLENLLKSLNVEIKNDPQQDDKE